MGEDYEHLVHRFPQLPPAPEAWAFGFFVPFRVNGYYFNAQIATGSQATIISVCGLRRGMWYT